MQNEREVGGFFSPSGKSSDVLRTISKISLVLKINSEKVIVFKNAFIKSHCFYKLIQKKSFLKINSEKVIVFKN